MLESDLKSINEENLKLKFEFLRDKQEQMKLDYEYKLSSAANDSATLVTKINDKHAIEVTKLMHKTKKQ